MKCIQTAEFVIGGYTDPSGSRDGLGALLLGYHNDAGELAYAGKVGTGFDDATLRELETRLASLQQSASPFIDRTRQTATVHWVKPTLVAQITFGAWTRENLLRHASFQGLREDKSAKEVTRDLPVAVKSTRNPKNKGAFPARTIQGIDREIEFCKPLPTEERLGE